MSTMNLRLPEPLKDFVNAQVSARGYSNSSEYVRELIRKDLDRQRLRGLILDGAGSPRGVVADADSFDGLRSPLVSDAAGQELVGIRRNHDGPRKTETWLSSSAVSKAGRVEACSLPLSSSRV